MFEAIAMLYLSFIGTWLIVFPYIVWEDKDPHPEGFWRAFVIVLLAGAILAPITLVLVLRTDFLSKEWDCKMEGLSLEERMEYIRRTYG